MFAKITFEEAIVVESFYIAALNPRSFQKLQYEGRKAKSETILFVVSIVGNLSYSHIHARSELCVGLDISYDCGNSLSCWRIWQIV